jgi:hypothetical protein
MIRSQFIKQNKLNKFTNTIADKIKNGFVIVERNDKMPFTILVKEGKKVNHSFNFFVCCATFGMWSLPWLYLTQVSSRTKKILIAIDEDGNVFEENCYMG